jgi:hypothetical protein
MAKTPTKKNTYFEDYDLYSDANPRDTIRIKYATLDDVKSTIKKLERLYKKGEYPHNRISQVVNVMTQRLRVIDPNSNRFKLSNKYFDFLKSRTREKNDNKRQKLTFNF